MGRDKVSNCPPAVTGDKHLISGVTYRENGHTITNNISGGGLTLFH